MATEQTEDGETHEKRKAKGNRETNNPGKGHNFFLCILMGIFSLLIQVVMERLPRSAIHQAHIVVMKPTISHFPAPLVWWGEF